ncbi:hypothetical protein BH20ACT21_BH20ACT21_14260 [soil metagenome]
MSPRKPAPKRVPAHPAPAHAPTRKRPRCTRCNRSIYVPPEWSMGAAVRRHYWAKHREVMMRPRQSSS